MPRRFHQVDVFGAEPLSGNPLAVVHASQGTRLGRSGRPRIEQNADGTVWVGGATVTCIDGELRL